MRRAAVPVAFLLLLACSCSSGDGDAAPSTSVTTSSSTATAPDPPERPSFEATVEALAADEMEGRDNRTPGSLLAQDLLVEELRQFAEPVGDDFRHPFDHGTNILGLVRGAELADQYVIIGAHYDHIGRRCPTRTPGDDICNGATDNAAGVAAVLEIGRRLAAGDGPRRSVIVAFWDAEEDGLLGARAYTANPPAPLAQTVAYLNWDIQGANLLPSLTDVTFMIGAETGGSALVEAAAQAAAGSRLDTLPLSLLFGQGRSDHAVFAASGIPTVFFTDANSGCYHTAQDDTTVVDFEKLGHQIDTGEALARIVAETDTAPTFVGDTPAATYDDAQSMLSVVSRAEPDFSRFTPEGGQAAARFLVDVRTMVEEGPDAFGDEALGILLGGSAAMVAQLTQTACDGFFG